MATRDEIQRAVDLLGSITVQMPILRVPVTDLPAWAEFLDVDDMTLALRCDGRVEATIVKWSGHRGHLIVEAIADAVRDMDLPPCPEDGGTGEMVHLPVDDMWRLFGSAVKEGAAR